MNDQLASPPSRKGHQDLLHALILLGTVPLLFFAAFKLVEKTAEVPNKPPPDVTKDVEQEGNKLNEKVNPVSVRPIPTKFPPPGEAWLREVAALEQRVAQLRSTSNVGAGRVDQIRQQLATLRQHIEQHLDAVPQSIHDDHSLRTARLRLADELDQIHQSAPHPAAGFDWKSAYAEFESEQRSQHATRVAIKVESLTTRLKEPHLKQIAAISQESKELRFQMQDISIMQFELQRNTKRELARLDRIRAFEPDRAEVQRLLKAFISHHNKVLGPKDGNWITVPEAQPISWSSLEKSGALQPTIDGLRTLSRIGCQLNLYPNTPRPMGSFPFPNGGELTVPHEIETTKRAQHLLKRHAEILVEERLLAP